jgi:hypothetical protein
MGAPVGPAIKIGGQLPKNLLFSAHYNAFQPKYGVNCQLRSEITVTF